MLRVARLVLVYFFLSSCLYAESYGSVAVSGGEQFNSSVGQWDSGTVMVSINGYVKTVSYGQFSTPDSIASGIAALFSSDCYGPANVKAVPGGGLYIKVRNGGELSELSASTYSSMSFQISTDSSIAPTTASASIANAQLMLGQSTGVDVQVSCGSACGQVTYRIDGNDWTTLNLDTGGHASAATPANLTPGVHNVVVKYLGSGAYMATTSNPVSFVVSSSANPIPPTGIYSYAINSYAPNGNISAYSDSVNGTWTNISYDSLDRLKGANQALNGINQTFCWSFDDYGNRTSSVCNPTSLLQFPASNQVPGLQYDSAGDVTVDGAHQYLYDAEGRICAVQYSVMTIPAMVGYVYDADGRRVAKGTISSWSCDLTTNGFSEDSGYIIGPNGEQATETDGAGGWKHTNVFAGSQLIGTYDPEGIHYHLGEWLGTRRVQTDFQGNQEATYQSLPYGEMVPDNDNPALGATEHHFTGKERDSESRLDYFGARYYASSMGRWMSPDWSASPEAVPYSRLDNPQSLNLYSYAGNNPLIHIDADGHCWPEWLCNFFTEVENKVLHGEFTTDTAGAKIRQLVREDAGHRERLQIEEQIKTNGQIQYGMVFSPNTLPLLLRLKPLHSGELLEKNSNIGEVRKMTTEQIVDSLKPGQKDSLKVKADGTVVDGNTRLRVLQERGFDTESLPREPYASEPIAPWEEALPPE